MKKTLLASALFAGIGAYAAIPADMNERADLVQKRNDTITANINKAYQQYLQASPILNNIEVQIRDYKRTDTGATDQTVIALDWNASYFGGEAPPVKELVFNTAIDYSDAVAKDGKLAVMKGELDTATLAKALDFSENSNDFKTLNEIVKHLELTTTLLDDDKLEQHIRIKPVDAKPEDGIHITYEGFDYHIKTTDKNLEHGYSTATLQSGKFEVANTQEHNDGPKKLTILPFSGEGEYKDNGDLNFIAKPFEIHVDDVVGKAENMEIKGKNMTFDPLLGGYLGEARYSVNNIAFASATMPEKVYISALSFVADNEKSGDLYSSAGKFEILPVKEAFAELTGGMSEALGVKSISIDAKLDKISGDMLKDLTQLQTDIQNFAYAGDDPEKQTEAKKAIAPRVDSLLAEAGKHGTILTGQLLVNAEPGDATVKAYFEVLKGSKMTFAELEAAGSANDPAQFIELLNKNVRFELDVVVPKALVDAVGVGAFLEGNPYLLLDGKNYKLNLKNSDKGITLNGQPMPM